MADILNIPVRNISDLQVVPSITDMLGVLLETKIPVGNLPNSLVGEAITLGQLKEIIALELKAVSPETLQAALAAAELEMQNQLDLQQESLNVIKEEIQVETQAQKDHLVAVEADIQNQMQIQQNYILTVETNMQAQVNANGIGNRAYKTYALMDADKVNIPAKSKVTVTNDPTPENNWDWNWDGVSFTKSNKDILVQAKEDATTKANNAENKAKNYTDKTLEEAVIVLKKADDVNIVCLAADSEKNALVWIDKATGMFNAVGLLNNVFANISALKKYDDSNYIPISLDSNGNMLAGINKNTHKFEAVGLEAFSQVGTKDGNYFSPPPLVLDINHVLSYGQSLSMGATATVILSVSQHYSNLTFNSGPRKDVEATSVIPLVEQFNTPSADGYTNRGETHCSGLANTASRIMMLEHGIDPTKHVIFASTAGHGGYTIDQLKKGSVWYSVLIDHVNKAKSLNIGKSYHVPVVPWIQGENNAVSGGLQTPYEVYKAGLIQLQSDANTDIKAITSQVDPVRFITYQMSYAARTWPDIAKAQLDLARENDNFMLATPMYHFPYAGDNVHLTNVGYKWMGAYFGRAYTQYMVEGRKPEFINPFSAQINGNQVIVKFKVPKLPLIIDTATLANTTTAGFKVKSGSTDIAITSVTASEDTVILQLASTPTSAVQVRYALDYLGTGLTITGGASGNLRDSTTETVTIEGVEKPLYHVCPHFEMTAFLDKGI